MNTVDALAVNLVETLQASGLDCALGGAIALGFWAIPRGTVDVDLNVFVPPEEASRVAETLEHGGCSLDKRKFLAAVEAGASAIAQKDGWRIDVFLPSIPFYELAHQRVRTGILLGKQVPLLDPESLAVFKMLFFRPKDLVDVAALISTQRRALDDSWVRKQLVEMMGESEARVQEWDRLVSEHRRN